MKRGYSSSQAIFVGLLAGLSVFLSEFFVPESSYKVLFNMLFAVLGVLFGSKISRILFKGTKD